MYPLMMALDCVMFPVIWVLADSWEGVVEHFIHDHEQLWFGFDYAYHAKVKRIHKRIVADERESAQ